MRAGARAARGGHTARRPPDHAPPPQHPGPAAGDSPLATATLARPALAQAGWPRSVTDMVGRGVTLPRPPRRVVAAESAVLLNLSLIHPDPVPLLVGMGGDLRRIDPGAMAALAARFLGLDAVPELTRQVGEDLPLERLIALAPDLVLMAARQHRRPGTAEALRTLERAGIPVVFIDFFINPLSRALPSLQLLAEVLDRREAAAAYAAFYTAKLEAVRRAVAGRRGPAVLLQAFPGRWPCCWVAGDQGGGAGGGAGRAQRGGRPASRALGRQPLGRAGAGDGAGGLYRYRHGAAAGGQRRAAPGLGRGAGGGAAQPCAGAARAGTGAPAGGAPGPRLRPVELPRRHGAERGGAGGDGGLALPRPRRHARSGGDAGRDQRPLRRRPLAGHLLDGGVTPHQR
ncbi:ABC transporter substrate-binding protein [Teichococcus aestuarii]|uniref:ABC transporter substrate-binding protein n=1 Tax=Teichococcus aestuarii TaxID=568898 RepID=UPI00360B4199